jgi:MFS transporter, DHA1 family, multidrug resistance protein
LLAEDAAGHSVAVPSRRFVPFVATMMSMGALSIDTILPAFGDMRRKYGLPDGSSKTSWLITAFFLGMALGQLFYGPVSDRFGRKPLLFAGLTVYVIGAFAAVLAPSLLTVCIARFVWGLGAASCRTVSVAMVRDVSSGSEMARIMSLAMSIFILVPIVAPLLAGGVIAVLPWQSVFVIPAIGASVLMVWATRMPETLAPEHRRALDFGSVIEAGRAVVSNRMAMGLGLAVMMLFGAMASFLSASELVVTETYDLEKWFPIIFSGMIAMIAISFLANSRLVRRYGTTRMLRASAVALVTVNVTFTAVVLASDGRPPLAFFIIGMGTLLAVNQLVIPNANTAAMQPMGAIAGTASSILGVMMTGGGALISSFVARFADGTATPIAMAFLVLTGIAALLLRTALRDAVVTPRMPVTASA